MTMKFTSTAAAALLAATACLQPALASAERVEAPVQLAAAEQDHTSFLFLLALLEGHLMVGHDLLKAGNGKLALPHFGHPVRELYDEIKGELKTRNVPAFDNALIDLEAQVAKAPSAPATDSAYAAVIATIHKARETVPADIRNSVPETVALCANVVHAAAGEYGEALERGKIANMPEYHDSHGFITYAVAEAERLKSIATPAQAELVDKLRAVLAKAEIIVGDLIPPERPKKSVSDYKAVAEEAHALIKH
jgi:hypothetical protein